MSVCLCGASCCASDSRLDPSPAPGLWDRFRAGSWLWETRAVPSRVTPPPFSFLPSAGCSSPAQPEGRLRVCASSGNSPPPVGGGKGRGGEEGGGSWPGGIPASAALPVRTGRGRVERPKTKAAHRPWRPMMMMIPPLALRGGRSGQGECFQRARVRNWVSPVSPDKWVPDKWGRASRAGRAPLPGAHGAGGGPMRSRKCLARICALSPPAPGPTAPASGPLSISPSRACSFGWPGNGVPRSRGQGFEGRARPLTGGSRGRGRAHAVEEVSS